MKVKFMLTLLSIVALSMSMLHPTEAQKRQIFFPPSPHSPPPPSPPSAPSPPVSPMQLLNSPGLVFGVRFPGYTANKFKSKEKRDVCRAFDTPLRLECSKWECEVSDVSTFDGVEALVMGYAYFKYSCQPSPEEVQIISNLRDISVKAIDRNSTAFFTRFDSSTPYCSCDGNKEVKVPSTNPFVYANISGIPGPPQCGARLTYNSNIFGAEFSQVGIDSLTSQFCSSTVEIDGGVQGVPGSGTCVPYGILDGKGTRATAKARTPQNGQFQGAYMSKRGAGYYTIPEVEVGPPEPIEVGVIPFTWDSLSGILSPTSQYFNIENGPYASTPPAEISASSPICVSSGCSGSPSVVQTGIGTQSGNQCTNADIKVTMGSDSQSTVVTGVAFQPQTNTSAPVYCNGHPVISIGSAYLQEPLNATGVATIGGGEVTGVVAKSAGSGYRYGQKISVRIPYPLEQFVGKFCSPTPIAPLNADNFVPYAMPLNASGDCVPMGVDTYSNKVCARPTPPGGIEGRLGRITCSTISSFIVQPGSTVENSCLILPQTFLITVEPAKPPPAPNPSSIAPGPAPGSPSSGPDASQGPAPAPAPASAPTPDPVTV